LAFSRQECLEVIWLTLTLKFEHLQIFLSVEHTTSVFTEIKKIKYGGQQLLNIAFQR